MCHLAPQPTKKKKKGRSAIPLGQRGQTGLCWILAKTQQGISFYIKWVGSIFQFFTLFAFICTKQAEKET